MPVITHVAIATLLVLALGATSLFAEDVDQFRDSDLAWEVLIDGVSRASQSEAKRKLVAEVESGKIDTRGTRVEINHAAVETTPTGSRPPLPPNTLRWHVPLGSGFNQPAGSRWYQLHGNTQVFRVFPGDQNMYGNRVGAGRSEAFAPNLGIRQNENQKMTFSARYLVYRHNGSKNIKIFQSKATAKNGLDPAWGVALWVEADGDVVIVKRKPKRSEWVFIDTGKDVGDSFNLRVTDDGLNYNVFIDDVEMSADSWDRGNLKSVCRWGIYVQGGTQGVLEGTPSDSQIVFVSGARVTKQ